MAIAGAIILNERTDITDPIPAGKAAIWKNGNDLKIRIASTTYTVATGLTQEQVEDIVGNLIQGSGPISVSYDDGASTLTLSLDQSQISHNNIADKGTKTHSEIDNHIDSEANPHAVTASQVGADPVGSASAAIAAHLLVPDPHPQYETSDEVQTKVDAHADLTNNPHGVTKTQVGLSNVDNTSDVNKPVSTAQANADSAVQDFAVQRSNHTGTQLSSTISDFANTVRSTLLTGISFASTAVITAGDSVLTSLGKLQAQISAIVFGTNFLEGASDAQSNTTSTAAQNKVQLSPTVVAGRKYRVGFYCETTNSSTTGITEVILNVAGSTQALPSVESEDSGAWEPQGGFYYWTPVSSGTFNITLQYRNQNGTGTSSIRRARLEFWRAS